jgi:uncharacterized protein (UPF0335 family)
MSGGIAGAQLRSLIERIERLEVEKAELAADIREVYLEAKATGFDPKIMRKVVQLRKMEPADRNEQEELLALYMAAVGLPSIRTAPDNEGPLASSRTVLNEPAGDGGAPAPTTQTGVAPPGPVLSTPTVESGPELGRMLSDAASDVAAAQLAALEPISGTRDLNEERMDCYQLGTVDAVPPSNPQATASDDEPPHNPGGGHEVISASIDEGRPRAAAPPSDDDLLDIPEFLRKPPPPRAA